MELTLGTAIRDGGCMVHDVKIRVVGGSAGDGRGQRIGGGDLHGLEVRFCWTPLELLGRC